MVPAALATLAARLDDLEGQLQLQEQHRGTLDRRRRGVDVVHRDAVVGAGDDHDRVLAAVLHERGADPGALVRVDRHAGRVDAFGGRGGRGSASRSRRPRAGRSSRWRRPARAAAMASASAGSALPVRSSTSAGSISRSCPGPPPQPSRRPRVARVRHPRPPPQPSRRPRVARVRHPGQRPPPCPLRQRRSGPCPHVTCPPCSHPGRCLLRRRCRSRRLRRRRWSVASPRCWPRSWVSSGCRSRAISSTIWVRFDGDDPVLRAGAEAVGPAQRHDQGRLPVSDHQGLGGGVRPGARRLPGAGVRSGARRCSGAVTVPVPAVDRVRMPAPVPSPGPGSGAGADHAAARPRRGAGRGPGCRAGVGRGQLLRRPGRRLDGHDPVLRAGAEAAGPAQRHDQGRLPVPDDQELAAAFAPVAPPLAPAGRRPGAGAAGPVRPAPGAPVTGRAPVAVIASAPVARAASRRRLSPRCRAGTGRHAALPAVRHAAAAVPPRLPRAHRVRRGPWLRVGSHGRRSGRDLPAVGAGRWRCVPRHEPAADPGQVVAGRPVEAATVPGLEPALLPLLAGQDVDPDEPAGPVRRDAALRRSTCGCSARRSGRA